MIRQLIHETFYAATMIGLLVLVGGGLLLDASEKGFAELLQILLLFISVILWSVAGFSKHVMRIPAMFMACIAIACIGRETSWGSVYDMPHLLSDRIEYGAIAILLIAASVCCIVAYAERTHIITWVKQHWCFPSIIYLGVSFLCLLMGDIFDHKIINIYASPIIEESCEIIAYTYFARAAYALAKVATVVRIAVMHYWK